MCQSVFLLKINPSVADGQKKGSGFYHFFNFRHRLKPEKKRFWVLGMSIISKPMIGFPMFEKYENYLNPP